MATPNHLRMKRVHAVWLIVGLIVLFPSPSALAGPGTSWEAETQGSPVATEIGLWTESEDGRSVRLEFRGGHVVGTRTTFKARWRTPFTPSGQRPRFDMEYELTNINDLGTDIHLLKSFRWREKGGRWVSLPDRFGQMVLKPGQNYVGGGTMFAGWAKRPMQFEWTLEGTIEAPTYLEGFVDMSIN